ncbi:MAG: hypothetical protein COV76_06405 [Candidatus Omnitrophica bacterium CG11_big_fil_rev_8_21_14_0_20_64_10]|nr:MAG: hypothetical protein COV76_06405 [Candidatus Omnitrophica bacterium CG11_big_fil_rev_8_21_14_0_20_64_10]
MRFFHLFLAAVLLWALSGPALADSDISAELRELRRSVDELKGLVRSQQGQIDELKQVNAELRAQPPAVPAGAVPAPGRPVGPAGRVATYGAQSGLQAFNPEIGLVADVVASLSQSKEDAEGNDKISVREMELAIGHDIDPYSRFDSTITLSDFEEVSIEEAYISHWGLPWEWKGRIGRMRPKIGKATAVHRDQLDTVDEPLVVQQFLGVEGLFRTGLEISRFLPAMAGPLTQELTAGVMEGGIGEGGNLFGETRRKPSTYAHLKNFFDVSDATSFELGGTYLAGSADAESRLDRQAAGVDATLIHHFNPTNKVKWQSEGYFQFRDDTEGLPNNPLGFYSLFDYRLSPRWGIGGRFDYVEPVDDSTAVRNGDTAWSGYLTFFQSEFACWRVQYQHVEEAEGGNDDRFMLQGTIAIGAHKHQLQ